MFGQGQVWVYRGLVTLTLIFSALFAGARGNATIVRASVENPSSVTVAGDFQHLVCSGDWQPNCTATHMTRSATDGVWRFSLALPAGDYNYKGVIDDDWGNGNFGLHAAANGPNPR